MTGCSSVGNDAYLGDFVIFGEPDIELLQAEGGQIQVKVNGVDVFHPQTGEIRSDGPDGIACRFIDTDYDEESFFSATPTFSAPTTPTKPSRPPSKPRSTKKLGQRATATPPGRSPRQASAGSR